MPKRRNLFQDLIAAIHEQFVGPRLVSESEMLVDRISGQEREVDIVIRTTLAGYDFVLSVECTSCRRPASIEWVEEMHSKHLNLPTKKLVLVSKAGFTGSAYAKARALGIECHSLDSAKMVNWTKYVDRQSRIFLAAIDAITAVFPYSPTYRPEGSYKGIPMETQFLDVQGTPRATAEEIANAFIANDRIFAATIAKMDVTNSDGWEIISPMTPGTRMRLPNGEEHEVRQLKVVFIAKPLLVPLDMARAGFKDAEISYGSSLNDKGEFLVTIIEKEGSTVKSQLRLRRPWGEVQRYSLAGESQDRERVASDKAMKALFGKTENTQTETREVMLT